MRYKDRGDETSTRFFFSNKLELYSSKWLSIRFGCPSGQGWQQHVLWLQWGTGQAQDKDEVMSQRMQYYTKRPYYQALNPIIRSQSPLSDIHCSVHRPAIPAAWALWGRLYWSLNLHRSKSGLCVAPTYCILLLSWLSADAPVK